MSVYPTGIVLTACPAKAYAEDETRFLGTDMGYKPGQSLTSCECWLRCLTVRCFIFYGEKECSKREESVERVHSGPTDHKNLPKITKFGDFC